LKTNLGEYGQGDTNKPIRKLNDQELEILLQAHPNIPRFGSRHDVWKGRALMTTGGLQQKDLQINHRGYLVSKYASKRAMERKNRQGADWVLTKNEKCIKANKNIRTLNRKIKSRENRDKKRSKIIRTLSDLYKTKGKLSPQIFLFS